MSLYIVDYKFHRDIVRTFLQVGAEAEIKPLLVMYHQTKSEHIEIKRIRSIPEHQKIVHVQYFDR